MSHYARIPLEDAYQMILDKPVNIIDIRDADSYKVSHITDAEHMDNSGVQAFMQRSTVSMVDSPGGRPVTLTIANPIK